MRVTETSFRRKHLEEEPYRTISNIVNLSLSEGVFPGKFKSAIVTPLLKKQTLNKDDLKNYRPVSGLNFISKVIERAVASQIKTNHGGVVVECLSHDWEVGRSIPAVSDQMRSHNW